MRGHAGKVQGGKIYPQDQARVERSKKASGMAGIDASTRAECDAYVAQRMTETAFEKASHCHPA